MSERTGGVYVQMWGLDVSDVSLRTDLADTPHRTGKTTEIMG